jgi:hypothetical protein
LALVAALPEGATGEAALDAWLSALEITASPRVLLPRGTTLCGQNSFVEVAWPRSAGAAPDELRLESAEDVESVLAEQGLVIAAELPSAHTYLVWSWAELPAPTTTRTLRVRGGATPLSLLPAAPFPILLNAITSGAMSYAGEVDASSLDVTFFAGPSEYFAGPSKRSDYRARIAEWLGEPADPLAGPKRTQSYLETRSRGLVYDWSIHQDLISVAPLIRTYASRASAELPELDVKACGDALADLRTRDSDLDSVDCGAARDASLALRTADPQRVTLQRFVVSGARGASADALSGGGEPSPPTLRAARLQAADCADLKPREVVDPVASGGDPGPIRPPRDDSEVVVDETVIVEEHEQAELDCSGSPEPVPDDGYYGGDDDDADCSSGTSSSASNDASGSETDCSSDTSTTSSSNGAETDCSDDTSSSASDDSEAASCSDDTSSTSSDDSGCSDDTSGSSGNDTGYDGDTCASVSATPRAAPQKSQAGMTGGKRLKSGRRLKTSLWSVAFAAMALPIRRRKRGARAVS